MTLDTVVLDALRITKTVIGHLKEIDCNHSIKEIVREALGHNQVPVSSSNHFGEKSKWKLQE